MRSCQPILRCLNNRCEYGNNRKLAFAHGMCYDGEQQREGSVKRMQKWVSVWGNAVSIAENRPERYAKDITLRYPIVSPFSGSAVRLTFDNYCGTEPVTLEKVTIFCGGAFHPVTFGGERRVTLPAEGNVISDTLETPVTAGEKLLVRRAVRQRRRNGEPQYFDGHIPQDAADLLPQQCVRAYCAGEPCHHLLWRLHHRAGLAG